MIEFSPVCVIRLQFYWGVLGLLSLDNSLTVIVVMATSWQPILTGWRFSSLLLFSSDLLAFP